MVRIYPRRKCVRKHHETPTGLGSAGARVQAEFSWNLLPFPQVVAYWGALKLTPLHRLNTCEHVQIKFTVV